MFQTVDGVDGSVGDQLLQTFFRLLTETKVTNEAEALAAMGRLHDRGVGTVVLSSSDVGDDDVLVALASTRTGRPCQGSALLWV